MELKVWVDGVVRVVCGLSEDTSCQDVVIALAQAIGQTGRYVLIQRLRDSERQLLATERPLESLSKLGQHGGEVRFYLRRTGPSASDGPSPSPAGGSAPSPLLPPPLPPRPAEPEPPRRGGPPKKSLTFNLGPSSSPRTKAKALRRAPPPPQDSPESRASPRHGPPSPSPSPSPHHAPPSPSPSPSPAPTSPSPPVGPSKDELLRQVLQQQETLRAGHAHLEVLQKESRGWERPSPSPSPSPSVQEELELLERAARRNRAELASEPAWGEELTAEAERERALERRLAELRAKMDDCGRRLGEVAARSARLEQDVLREGGREGGGAGEEGEESLGAARAELRSRDRRGEELEAELKETDRALGKAESLLQSRQAELAELNKELRQCNLQQFIQQAGVLPSAHTHTPSDLDLHTHTPSDLDLHTHTHTLRPGPTGPSAALAGGLQERRSLPALVRVSPPPHGEAVPGSPAQPAEPPGVQSEPRGPHLPRVVMEIKTRTARPAVHFLSPSPSLPV